MTNAFSYIQWKIAMSRMQDANMAASEITEQGSLTQPAARKIAPRSLSNDRRSPTSNSIWLR
jgi:hypothetical protein